ncbi:MAG: hypothetical protein OEY99_06410 [Aigarchaeota archaeon]|nr:hypothetical protein [Aigarchaeota archaeon]
MWGAVELATIAINETIVPERERTGGRGYGRLAEVRLLIYVMLVGIQKDQTLRGISRRTSELGGAGISNEASPTERR